MDRRAARSERCTTLTHADAGRCAMLHNPCNRQAATGFVHGTTTCNGTHRWRLHASKRIPTAMRTGMRAAVHGIQLSKPFYVEQAARALQTSQASAQGHTDTADSPHCAVRPREAAEQLCRHGLRPALHRRRHVVHALSGVTAPAALEVADQVLDRVVGQDGGQLAAPGVACMHARRDTRAPASACARLWSKQQ